MTPLAPPPSAAIARTAVGDVEPAILRISREVWENAELGRQEMKSHAIHLRELEAQGFTITSRNTSGYPTAFIAEWTQGTGGPLIAYLPEYDALPGKRLGIGKSPLPNWGGLTFLLPDVRHDIRGQFLVFDRPVQHRANSR